MTAPNTYFLQGEKRKFATTVEKFEEIKAPTLYHRLAFRYELDTIINRATATFDQVVEIHKNILDSIKDQNLSADPLPPIVSDRIDEILKTYMEESPNLTEAEKHRIIGGMFMEGGEFEGLFDENGVVDQKWLETYLSNPNNQPSRVSIPFTEEMAADALVIMNRDDLTDDQKDDLISAFFAPGGKYDGYIQADGTVDESKIKKSVPVPMPEESTSEAPF
jgi:hypothetical protein